MQSVNVPATVETVLARHKKNGQVYRVNRDELDPGVFEVLKGSKAAAAERDSAPARVRTANKGTTKGGLTDVDQSLDDDEDSTNTQYTPESLTDSMQAGDAASILANIMDVRLLKGSLVWERENRNRAGVVQAIELRLDEMGVDPSTVTAESLEAPADEVRARPARSRKAAAKKAKK